MTSILIKYEAFIEEKKIRRVMSVILGIMLVLLLMDYALNVKENMGSEAGEICDGQTFVCSSLCNKNLDYISEVSERSKEIIEISQITANVDDMNVNDEYIASGDNMAVSDKNSDSLENHVDNSLSVGGNNITGSEMLVNPIETTNEEVDLNTSEIESELTPVPTIYSTVSGFEYDENGMIIGCAGVSITDGVLVLPSDAACCGVRSDAFAGLGDEVFEIYIPANIVTIEAGAIEHLYNLCYVEVSPSNPVYRSVAGELEYK